MTGDYQDTAAAMDISLFLSQILGQVGDGIVIEDNAGYIAFANPAAERLLGQGLGELCGRPWVALTPCVPAAMTVGAGSCEVQMRRRDGSVAALQVRTQQLLDCGQPCGTLWLFSDRTEHHDLQAQLHQSEKMAGMGRLVLGVAHELNNALTIILLQIRLLNNLTPMLPRFQEGLAGIKEQVRRIMRMMDDLLAAGRTESTAEPALPPSGDGAAANQASLPELLRNAESESFWLPSTTQEPAVRESLVDVNAAIQHALDLRLYELQSDDIDITLDLAPDLPAAWLDPDQLQQVLLNLINNAQQAVGTVHRRGQLGIETVCVPNMNGHGRHIQIRVSDNGPGIPFDVMPRLFQPFFTTKPPGQGTGLGLAVCSRIVREYGGRIWAENNSESGVSFFVELPLPA